MISRRSMIAAAAAASFAPRVGVNWRALAGESTSNSTVFAWYILQFGAYGNTVAGFEKEIREAQSYGVDGFVLDMFGWKHAYTPYGDHERWASYIFEAAANVGATFKLFFAVDWKNSREPAADAALMMAAHGEHPNYFRYDGRPVLSAWDNNIDSAPGSSDEKFWSAVVASVRAAGRDVMFVPCFGLKGIAAGDQEKTKQTYRSQFNEGWLADLCQGLICWNDYVPSILSENNEAVKNITQDKKLLFIPSVAAWFGIIRFLYLNKSTEFLEYNGYEGMSALWQQAIGQGPPIVLLATWNDYTESYMSPVGEAQLRIVCRPSTWQVSSEYLYCHSGFTELTKYFIEWYKTGLQPSWRKDAMFVAYRTAPTSVVATAARPETKISWNQQTRNPTLDDLYITTICNSPAVVQVSSGGDSIELKVGAGLVHSRAPFTPGAQSFSLVRDGNTLVSISGADVVSTLTKYQNMNPVSYYAYAQ